MPEYSLFLTIRFFSVFCLLFWIGFSYLCFLWTERDEVSFRNIIGAVQIALLRTFKLAVLGLALIVAVFLVLQLF